MEPEELKELAEGNPGVDMAVLEHLDEVEKELAKLGIKLNKGYRLEPALGRGPGAEPPDDSDASYRLEPALGRGPGTKPPDDSDASYRLEPALGSGPGGRYRQEECRRHEQGLQL